MHPDYGGLQVQMLLLTRVRNQHAPDLEAAAHRLFVPYYSAAPDLKLSKNKSQQDLTLRHLVWEQSAPRGRSGTLMPVNLVVELDVVRKQVCIFPHFSYCNTPIGKLRTGTMSC